MRAAHVHFRPSRDRETGACTRRCNELARPQTRFHSHSLARTPLQALSLFSRPSHRVARPPRCTDAPPHDSRSESLLSHCKSSSRQEDRSHTCQALLACFLSPTSSTPCRLPLFLANFTELGDFRHCVLGEGSPGNGPLSQGCFLLLVSLVPGLHVRLCPRSAR